MQSQPSPKAQLQMVKFKAGSFIVIENKTDSNNFYIIRQGNVQVSNSNEKVIQDTSQILGPGDFFAVISCMSRHPRIENATARTDCTLISVNYEQFGILIQNHTPIAMKIILSFSQKLRHFDMTIARLTLKKEAKEDPNHLYDIGEYYYKQRRTKHAVYVYMRFMQYCPNSPNVADTRAKLKQLGVPEDRINQPLPTPTDITRKFTNDTILFSEHEPGDELFIIQSGKVKITKIVNNNEVLIAILGPGEIFGEMALLENKPRSASAIAYGDMTAMVVNKTNFQAMVTQQPQMGTKLITILSDRVWIAYKQLNNTLITDPIGKIWDTLLTQLQKERVKIAPRTSHVFPFGAKELISMVGFNPAEGNVHLKNFLQQSKVFSPTPDQKLQCSDIEEIRKNVDYFQKMDQRKREIEQSRLGKR